MSLVLIRKSLETHLAAMSPAMPTAYENAPFIEPTATPPALAPAYQRANLLPANPDNSTQGQGMYQEVGIFQVLLCYPIGAGTADAYTRAQAVRDHYRRGTTLVQGGVTVIVDLTPRISPAYPSGDRYCIPVSVSWHADIYT